MILVLFTASYPYANGSEQTFIRMELPYLVRSFDRVILVPEKRETKVADTGLGNIEIETAYGEHLRKTRSLKTFLRGLSSGLVYAEIRAKPWLLLKPIHLKRLLFFAGQAELTRSWVIAWVQEKKIEPHDCLFYTYWFDQSALGIGIARSTMPDLQVVSRAHGYDVYEDRRTPPYWPCREAALQVVDALFPDSEAATTYLRHKYPESLAVMKTARLGVPDPQGLSPASSDGTYRILSCSRILPIKRVGLILEGIKAAAHRRPKQRFEWRHFGTGPLESELAMAKQNLPSNVNAIFAGYSNQAELLQFYRENPADVFINVSSSEGTPVAMMEAISCGIPVIATAVGGNKEIVSEKNGCLLDPNPSPDQIADVLLSCWDDPSDRRTGSRELWEMHYDADRNYREFISSLIAIRSQRPVPCA